MRGFHVSVSSPRQVTCALVELGLVVAALPLAVLVRGGGDATWFSFEGLLPEKAVATALVFAVAFYYADLYDDFALRPRLELVLRLVQAFLFGSLVLALFYYLVEPLRLGRGTFLIFVPLAFAAVLGWRLTFLWILSRTELTDNVLILGTGQSAQQLAVELRERRPLGLKVVGFLGEHRAEVGRRLVGPTVLGTVGELESVVAKHKVGLIVVALDDRRGRLPVAHLLRCRLAGVRIEEATDFFERLTGRLLLKNLRPSWLVFGEGFHKPRLLRNGKQTVEFVIALVGLVLVAPLLAVLALLVKLDSDGPVFYRQERVGENGEPFLLIKFRTMRVDAESKSGPVWAVDGPDPRVTRVGRWLRKLRLDELPQLINVIRGEMSFVGPRPERPSFVDKLTKVVPYYGERHSVKPGITGWAQVKFRYGSTIEDAEEKLQYDLYYIKHMSVVFDVSILVDTVKVMAVGRGR